MKIRERAVRVAIAAVVPTMLLAAGSCGVDRKCRADEDCDAPAVCLPSGRCGIECRENEDCNLDEICEGNRCRSACLGCSFPHAESECIHGECQMLECQVGWHDVNGEQSDGCEYACTITRGGVEFCDYVDNDCNGVVDDDFDVMVDVRNCGECGIVCFDPPNAVPDCDNGTCRYHCEEGWWDTNLNPSDGCEADTCEETNGGVEACDMIDNDCDGDVDEGIIKDTVDSCGNYCVDCDLPHADPACIDGVCRVASCHGGYIDCVITEPGCERACTPSGEESCDGVDNDCDCLVDEGLLCCPEGMEVVSGLFCMDKWEASRPDATATSYGIDTSMAISQSGVLPWNTGPGSSGWNVARDACAAAGKRLCSPSEWYEACAGPGEMTYAYGNDYDPDICNGIDAHCETPYEGCGHEDYLAGDIHFHIEPTGAFPSCTNPDGIFDLNGNLWEWVGDGGLSQRGGAYNCGDSAFLHQCTFESSPGRPAAGFRCCL
jgi:hypothetical protein